MTPIAVLLPQAGAVKEGEQLLYMGAAVLFILGIKRLSGVKTARSGNALAALGMLLAVAVTMVTLWGQVGLLVLGGGVAVGVIVGLALAIRVPLTAMPELVAFFNGLGGAASLLVALAQVVYFVGLGDGATMSAGHPLADGALVGGGPFAAAVVISILIGAVTLSGSLVAYGKLAGKVDTNHYGPIGTQVVNLALAAGALLLCWYGGFVTDSPSMILWSQLGLAVVALTLGVGLVVPIGGADMPVVISLLNSYSGLAACATGFVLENNLLIVAGSLVGAAGLILTNIMCKAMNRSLANVMFAKFGGEVTKDDSGYTNVKKATADEIAPILESARSLIVVPGYGLAVAQAQHKVRELGELLQGLGCDVKYAIHPVAGRMPGHMNVLLAEADVPYDQLYELENIDGEFKNTDVAIVIGANDVCNPVANTDPTSPIAGMPVLSVWDAQTVIVVKRSLSAGYAGIKNPLFEADNTLMLFADAKQALEDLVSELKSL
jgi:NAD(P) transhydrogenase subunit beta